MHLHTVFVLLSEMTAELMLLAVLPLDICESGRVVAGDASTVSLSTSFSDRFLVTASLRCCFFRGRTMCASIHERIFVPNILVPDHLLRNIRLMKITDDIFIIVSRMIRISTCDNTV